MEENGLQAKRLYKSRRNKIIDGVCGGFAEYFDVDPSIIRLLWVLVTLMGGAGFVAYLVAMIIMPANPEHIISQQAQPSNHAGDRSDKRRFFGVLLVLIGSLILLVNFGWFWDFGWWSFTRSVFVPLLIIGLGAFLIYLQTTRKKTTPVDAGATPETAPGDQVRKEFKRCRENRKLFGVCCGIGRYFNVDPTIIRFAFVIVTIISFGWGGLLVYIILGIVMPEEKSSLKSI